MYTHYHRIRSIIIICLLEMNINVSLIIVNYHHHHHLRRYFSNLFVYLNLLLLLLLFCLKLTEIDASDHDNYNYEQQQQQHSSMMTTTINNNNKDGDMSLWIDEMQVKQFFNGFPMKIHAIVDGVVLPYVLDPNFEKYLPIIPSQVTSVNFTWKSGINRNYYYDFDQLQSFNNDILKAPVLSIESKGLVPKQPKVFQVFIPCVGNQSGIASFTLGLRIINIDTNQYVAGTPIRLKLQKQCTYHGPDPECDKKCGNNGFLGKYCESALCYPQCMNGGTCIAPGVCVCSQGFQGLHCEGGICSQKCLNGGKCIQKDSCLCRRGYYGPRCEYSKCSIPCLNNGKCAGVNRCRCRKEYSGSQCQIQTNNTRFHRFKNRNHRKKSKKKFV
ncbi:WNT inhibitory factor 1 isoform X2 [Dermatophagoides pteronyssinus]|uniref:WNT inhibitory factor 1 isoform X2 n=1 Tax=Dermatophagoides pteronyssinus TaxID=6956 RepID=UPI003F665C34